MFKVGSALNVVLCVCGVWSGFPAPAAASQTHKLEVRDARLGRQLLAQGARLIADYGGYQLFELSVSQPLVIMPQVEVRDQYNFLLLHAAQLDTSSVALQGMRKPLVPFRGKRLRLIQFAGPVQPAWRDALLGTGVEIVAAVPHNGYLVYGDSGSLGRLQAFAGGPQVQWEGAYLEDYKLHPAAKALAGPTPSGSAGNPQFAIQLVQDSNANPQTVRLLEKLKLEPLQRRGSVLHYVNVVARLSAADLAQVAAQPDVVSIQLYAPRRKFCEIQDQIVAGNLSGTVPSGPGYLAWLAGRGFTQGQFNASGFLVDITDSGVDDGSLSPKHFGLHTGGFLNGPSRVLYSRLEGTPNPNSTVAGCDGHGTLNSHILGGYDDFAGFPYTDNSGFHYGLGVCPFVNLGASVIFDPDIFTSPNYNNLQSEAYQSGARISNNSWGANASAVYDIDAQNYDALVRDAQPAGSTFPSAGNQEMVLVFAAGNNGPRAQTIGSPGSAKNVLCIGAAENVQAFGGMDGSGVTDAQANSANDMVSFSSRGPCADGRHKPDLVAPGTHVSGGVAQDVNPGPDGTASPCFTGDGVSGGVAGSLFFPTGQQYFTASSGTSHATPCVSAGCALLRQYFINHSLPPPSPAMTKAWLMNSARYLTGAYAADTLWSDIQGMGELNLGTAFDGTPRFLRDQLAADLFIASGQVRHFDAGIVNSNQPLRITLAWTDAPGSTTGAAYNNNLDLVVTVNGVVYKGNNFSGQYSLPHGTSDAVNNVESVFLPAGLAGKLAVDVVAVDINSDGVPQNAYPVDQDFALVMYNAAPSAVPFIASVTGSNVVVGLSSVTGVSYSLQYKDSLAQAQWLPLSSPTPGTGGVLTLVDTNAPVHSRFYSVLAN